MRPRILLLIACAKSLNFSPRRLHLQRLFSRRWKLKRKEPTTMLRNQDRPELLLFVTTNAARWTDGVERPGVARLVAEAADVDALEGAAHLQEGEQLHDAPVGGREV